MSASAVMLTVIDTAHGVPAEAIAHRFVAPGGSIGRAPNNHLVLPDPERSVSRTHVRVQFRKAGPRVICVGVNAVSVNGVVVEQGEEAACADGDRIMIGNFTLKASVQGI